MILHEALMAALTVKLLEKSPELHPSLWLAVPLASAGLTLVIGLLNLRPVWRVSPVEVLRES